jgi:FtsP/CotA-like multicopper oxidase with cupredoxin domain
MIETVARVTPVLLVVGALLAALPGAAQPRPRDPYAYLTAAAVRKIRPLPDSEAIRRTGRTREYTLDIRPGPWEPVTGVRAAAITINGTVPGPVIRATEGDRVVVTVKNNLEESTAIHWHGLHVPNAMDGVEGLTQQGIDPGQAFRYEFLASHAGTFMYHSHAHARAVEQIDSGLYGMFVIDPQNARGHPKFDREFLMMLSAWAVADGGGHGATPGGHANAMGGTAYSHFTINGRAYPDAPEWAVREGEVVRVRVANVSNLIHPMHLHGHDFVVLAKDGEPLKTPLPMNTVNVAPGETYDIAFVANNPGAWVFHCHELHHTMNGSTQPGGLIQVIRYDGGPSPGQPPALPRPAPPSGGGGHSGGH